MLLFGPDLVPGFHHRDAFVTTEEESRLAEAIAGIEFQTFEMRGVVAKRRVAFFGRSYDEARGHARPIPEFLYPLRERFAAWANVDPQAFAMALINEYRPGAPIGWHRDAPQIRHRRGSLVAVAGVDETKALRGAEGYSKCPGTT